MIVVIGPLLKSRKSQKTVRNCTAARFEWQDVHGMGFFTPYFKKYLRHSAGHIYDAITERGTHMEGGRKMLFGSAH